MRTRFINSQEILLAFSNTGEHVSDTAATAADALGLAHDHVEKFFRIDVTAKPWKFEDVTEEIAAAWLEKNSFDPTVSSVAGFGPWLEESQSLEDWIENYGSERSDYDEHNTMGQ